MQKTSIVVFDIDGTLTDSVLPHQTAFEAALRSFDFPALRVDWATYQHHSDSAIFAEAWEEAAFPGAPDLLQLEGKFQVEFDQAVIGHPLREVLGGSSFLKSLEQSEWVACFATGSLEHGAKRKLASLSAAIDLELLVTASEYTTREEIVGIAIDRAKRKYSLAIPKRVVSIGDGLWDLLTALNLGLDFIGVAEGKKAEVLLSRGARVVPDLTSGLSLLSV